jgi:hypothetical protein
MNPIYRQVRGIQREPDQFSAREYRLDARDDTFEDIEARAGYVA